MSITIYVANLPSDASEQSVQSLFSPYGEVHAVNLISDSDSGEFLGYGFVEMDNDPADQAIRALDGTKQGSQTLQVNQARGRSSNR